MDQILLQHCKTLQGSRNNALRCTARLHYQINLTHAYGQIDPCMAKFSPLPASGIHPEGLSHAQGVKRAKYPLCNQWFVCSSNTRCPKRSPGGRGRAGQSPETKGGCNGREITTGQNMSQKLQRPKWVPQDLQRAKGIPKPIKTQVGPKSCHYPVNNRYHHHAARLLSFVFHLQKELQNLLQTAVANPPYLHKCSMQPQALDCTSMGAAGMGSMPQSHCNTPQKHQAGLFLAKINSHLLPLQVHITPLGMESSKFIPRDANQDSVGSTPP